MRVKNKLEKQVIKKEKFKIENNFKDFIKKILVISMIATNIFFYIPTVTFAADNDDEKVPATVPAAANEIISKYVSVKSSGGSATSGTGGVITTYEESGDGWDSVTEVKSHSGVTRTYRNYKQYNNGNSYWNNSYWASGTYKNIAGAGCGPTAVAIVLSGYGYDTNPGGVVDVMHNVFHTDDSTSFQYLIDPLKYIGNIDCEYHYGSGTSSDISIIRENLSAGRPVIINAPNHYVVYLGEDENGNLIISDPGAQDGGHARYGATLEDVINNGNITCGYILIKSDGNASSNGSSTSKSSSNTDKKSSDSDKKSSSKTENNSSSNPTGTGEAKIDDSYDINNGGYASIFTSGTTGRQFKEYKQNIEGWDSKYPISHLANSSGWKSECGVVSVMIVGSGYTENATFEDSTQKMENSNGSSRLGSWLSEYTGQSCSFLGSMTTKEDFANKLADGCVAVVHSSDSRVTSSGTHFMSVLDISSDKTQVYLSNPWNNDSTNGWLSIDTVYSLLDDIAFVTNDGSSVNYGAGGSSSGSSSTSSVNMSGNIVENGRNGYKIDIDWDEEIDGMLETLKEKNFKLEKYLDKSLQKEYLKNMLKAAIVTQYPDLRTADEIAKDKEIPANETQGCIKIKRYVDGETKAFAGNSLSNPVDSEDGGMYLSYMPYNDFSKLINEGNTSAMNYFSMDSRNNIVVAGWETLEVNVTIQQIAGDPDPNPDSAPEPRQEAYSKLTEKKVDYINQVSNYTMPFSLLWSLLVYGNDEAFVNDVAKLVIDTEIVIGSYDATNVKKSTYTDTYEKKYHTNRTAGIGNYDTTQGRGYEATASSTGEKSCTYEVIETHILKTDTPSLKLKYANTWTAIYNNEYKVNNKDENPIEDSTTLEDEYIDSTYDYKYNDETEEVVNSDESLQEDIDKKIEELRKETSEYNQANFAYRYEILNTVLPKDPYLWTKDSHDYCKLLYDEDVQNYIINMIVNENSEDYILDTFVNDEAIKRRAKKISETNYLDIQKGAGQCVQRLVRELEENNLKNRLTKNGADTRLNKTYSAKVTSVATEESISKENREEEITTNVTKAEVQEVTSTNGKVTMKTDKNSDENSFVKLFYHSKKAKGNLKIVGSWFFESMEQTAAIADLEDLVKYLFQIVYNQKSEFTKEEIQSMCDLFDPEKMSSVSRKQTSSGTIVGGASYSSITISDEDLQVLYKLVQAEGGGGTHEQVMYITCTILNRILSSTFEGNTVSEVANASGQFEVMWNGMYDAAVPSDETISAVDEAIQTGDVTGGSIGFQNDWLYDSQYPNQTYETPIELLRETWPSGSVVVFFTTASIQAELNQYK